MNEIPFIIPTVMPFNQNSANNIDIKNELDKINNKLDNINKNLENIGNKLNITNNIDLSTEVSNGKGLYMI